LEARGCKGLSEPQVKSVAIQVTTGLAYLHTQGVIHR
jgi:serine/threonine protein kinase